jgi:predicted DNA-binding protein with PD1-like motif
LRRNYLEYAESKIGRVFILRLHGGDHLPDVIESFAREKEIFFGICYILGGIKSNGRIVVGPLKEDKHPINPLVKILSGVSEVFGIGTIFPDETGNPRLHMHAGFGRGETTTIGCIRLGIDIWQVGEVVILEITNIDAYRKKDPKLGFHFLTFK